MKSLIDGRCFLAHGIAATGAGARSPDQAVDRRRKRRAAVLHGAGVLGEEGAQVAQPKFPGTLAASLKHDVFVALSGKRASQPAALARTIKRKAAVQVSSSPQLA